jgi:hypothetical protein
MNEIKLVALFCYICESHDTDFHWNCQRFSNNSNPLDFIDEELLAIYIYAVMELCRDVKALFLRDISLSISFARQH